MNNKKITIYLIRHGQAHHNVRRRTKIKDPGLTKMGIKQAKRVKLYNEPDLVLFSPLSRTIETTQYIFKKIDEKFIPCSDLQETNAGVYPCDTGTYPEILQQKYRKFDFSNLHRLWYRPKLDLKRRVKNFLSYLSKIVKDDKNKKISCIVIVAHAGVIYEMIQKRSNNCQVHTCTFENGKLKIID